MEKQFEVLKWEYEVLQVRFDRVMAERDELKARFSRAVLEVQQQASFKCALLEAKLKNLEGKDMGPRELRVSTFRCVRSIYCNLTKPRFGFSSFKTIPKLVVLQHSHTYVEVIQIVSWNIDLKIYDCHLLRVAYFLFCRLFNSILLKQRVSNRLE